VESRATTHGVRGAELRTGLTGRKGCKAGGPGISSGLVELALQAAIAKPCDAAWAKRDCQHTGAKVQTRGLHGCRTAIRRQLLKRWGILNKVHGTLMAFARRAQAHELAS
jgi:hypothetical protein